MSDIDRIFARLGGGQDAPREQRELRSIPRRGGATGSRVVEVVRLPARGDTAGRRGGTGRPAPNVHAQTWDEGFPARSVASPSPIPEPRHTGSAEPVAHVMPVWERSGVEPASEAMPAPVEAPSRAKQDRAPSTRRVGQNSPRRVADPFDTTDDGANCMRCGYLIEPARERRGLMTCAGCG